jgi:hypothetical protein
MKQGLLGAAGLLLALTLTLVLRACWLPGFLSPDLVLLGVMWLAFRAPGPASLVGAFAAGYAVGSFSPIPAGAAACGKLMAAGLAVQAGGVVDTRGRPVLLAVVFVGSLVDSLVCSGVAWFLGVRLTPLAGSSIARAAATTLAAFVLLWLSDWLAHRRRLRGRPAW